MSVPTSFLSYIVLVSTYGGIWTMCRGARMPGYAGPRYTTPLLVTLLIATLLAWEVNLAVPIGTVLRVSLGQLILLAIHLVAYELALNLFHVKRKVH